MLRRSITRVVGTLRAAKNSTKASAKQSGQQADGKQMDQMIKGLDAKMPQ
jgi:hypothetical protein